MNENPTRVTFDPDALTVDQLDGFACVTCGADLMTGIASVPVDTVDGGQVFACGSHVDNPDESEQRPDPNLCATCGRDFTAGRAVIPNVPVGRVNGVLMFACASHVDNAAAGKSTAWPDGELPDVRDLAERTRRAAAQTDELATEFRDDSGMSDVLSEVADALRRVLGALQGRGDVGAALDVAETAIGRARTALNARRAR